MRMCFTGAFSWISAPNCRADDGDRFRHAAGAAFGQSPRPEGAVDVAHVVVEQHVGGAGRSHAEERADDPGGGHRRLQHVGLEPLIEEVHRAHRQQLQLVVAIEVGQVAEPSGQVHEGGDVAQPAGEGIGRRHCQDVLGKAAHLDHRAAVFVIDLGIGARMPGNLAERARVIVHAPQVVAARHRREGAVERQDLEPVPRQIQLPDDFRPQQRDDVRADRESEAREDFFADRGAADDVTPLEHQHLAAGAREVSRGSESVVPGANDDGVILRWHLNDSIGYRMDKSTD